MFRYDVNHNLREHGLRHTIPGAALQFIPQNMLSGRVIKRGNDTYRYDTCGRLETKLVLRGGFRPAQWRYRWDDLGQLSELITPQGERWQYRYDPFGRRISKRRLNTTTGIAGYDFHWSGDQLVAETPVYADGTVATENSIYWLYEPGALTPGARYENGELHYVLRDHMGTPRELLTETGQVAWAQKLSVWGKAQHWHSGAPAANEEARSPDCPWRFAGQYADEESGLHYNRFRYYDNDTGQYVSPDPIGLLGGTNPYSYVSNPLKYVDPLGLCKTDLGNSYPGPKLPDNIASTFDNGIYTNRKLTQDELLYKYHGIDNRTGRKYSWLTNESYSSEDALRKDLAIRHDWGINISDVSRFKVPQGTWLSEGPAAAQGAGYPGGGYQAVITNVPDVWVTNTTQVPW